MDHTLQKRILQALLKGGRNGLRAKEIAQRVKCRPNEGKHLNALLDEMVKNAEIVRYGERYKSLKSVGLTAARITRIQRTFGFASRLSDGGEIFIPGKFLMGALPDDLVLVKTLPAPQGLSAEGAVKSIVSFGPGEFTGVVVRENGRLMILPDQFLNTPVELVRGSRAGIGEKVVARVIKRGERHSEHKAKILSSFGSSDSAAACAAALLEIEGIAPEFPSGVTDEARYLEHRGLRENDLHDRLDLRREIVFTIDGAESKDLDDAISLEKDGENYHLGVHIADVSFYVRSGSLLDREAFERGTSVYYADKVVPMLPKELSNGICSLNPEEDRLAFSALLTFDKDAEMTGFTFKKSVIRSRVKGVYTEVNALLDGTATEELAAKYGGVSSALPLMKELAEKMMKKRERRGAPELDTAESKIIIGEDGITADVLPRTRGFAERMIEEFMLAANEAAATLAREQEIPFVYRVHENPPDEKLETLTAVLKLLGMNTAGIRHGIRPKRMAEILEAAKGTPEHNIVNVQVLRAMAKAKYSESPLGHYGLALENYAHFTSPIRRYPDLMIHRILSDLLVSDDPAALTKRYRRLVHAAAAHSTETELRAVRVERGCEDCYKAEFMKGKIGESFEGIISGMTPNGFFVELPNTVEGMVRVEDLPEGPFEFDGYFEMKNRRTGKAYRVGQPFAVTCVAADVNSGRVDFVPQE